MTFPRQAGIFFVCSQPQWQAVIHEFTLNFEFKRDLGLSRLLRFQLATLQSEIGHGHTTRQIITGGQGFKINSFSSNECHWINSS